MIQKYFNKYLPNSKQRSIDILVNIIYSFFLKFGVAICGLLLVPITLNYLEAKDYGVWLTLSSISAWFYFFDIGLANGFRNKFTQAITLNDDPLAKKYVSTTYAIIIIICFVLFVVFEGINYFLDWNRILNTNMDKSRLNTLVHLIYLLLCFKMVLSTLTTTLVAYHKVAISNVIEFFTSLLILTLAYVFNHFTTGNILYTALINSLTPVIILLLSSIICFNTILKTYKPSRSLIDFSLVRFLFTKGVQFFIIQLAVVLMFTANNIVITQLFGPEFVTPFSIVNKYFTIPIMGFGIIIMPFWSSFTDAYHKKDIAWIKNMINKLLLIWLGLAFCLLLMVLALPFVLDVWIKRKIEYNQSLIWYSAIFVLISSWNSIFSNFINSVDKIRVQFLGSIGLIIINVPLSIFLCKYIGMGIEGVMLSCCICLLPGSILSPYQYYFIINNKAKGIWNK